MRLYWPFTFHRFRRPVIVPEPLGVDGQRERSEKLIVSGGIVTEDGSLDHLL
jgi:hypothetical protein